MSIRRTLLVAVVTAAALAHRPTRQVLGEWMITAGVALAFGPPPPMAPGQVAAGERRLMEELGLLKAKGNRNGHGPAGSVKPDREPI